MAEIAQPDQSLVDEINQLGKDEGEASEEVEETPQPSEDESVDPETSEEPKEQTEPEAKAKEDTQEVKSEERPNPRLLKERNELRRENAEHLKTINELNDRITKFENGEFDDETVASRQYIKDVAKLETMQTESNNIHSKEVNEFYAKHPEAIELQDKIEEMASENPNLSYEFIYKGLNPAAFVDKAELAKQTPKKYSTAGNTPAYIGGTGEKKPIEKMGKEELEAEMNALVKQGV